MADVFISYSRANREFADQLRANLEALGFSVWRDVHQMQVGDDWWRQITEAVEGSHTMILCMSPGAIASTVVAQEWQYARQVGTRVMPVFAADIDFSTVPRWMSRVDWADFRAGAKERDAVWGRFIDQLRRDYDRRRVPFMADKLPEYFVPRPEEFDSLLNALVDSNGAVAITAAVKGAGGYGKTTLAMALCHDVRVRGAFDDGILWVTLGEKPTEADLIRKASDLITLLTGEAPQVATREAIKAALTEAIGDRYILLVIDDLWRKHDADIFLTGGKNSAVLITTRYEAQLPDSARFRQNVDAMRLAQAVQLLAWNIDVGDMDSSPLPAKRSGEGPGVRAKLESLAKRLGEWAVLLRLVNGTLHQRMERGESLEKAIEYADKALTRKGLIAFDPTDPQERADAVRATLDVSIDLLSAEQQAQFARLAVFPEDADIPFGTLEKLWGLDDFDTEEVITALNNASLLLNFALDARVIRLHDVVRHYLIGMHRADLSAWQAAFVDALVTKAPRPEGEGFAVRADNEYEWRHIAYHLIEAGRLDTLRGLLLDFEFLHNKLHATGDPVALVADCNYLPEDRTIDLVGQALSISTEVLRDHPDNLALQLAGRLWTRRASDAGIDALCVRAHGYGRLMWADKLPNAPLQQAGGALIRVLAGHTAQVNSASYSPDGRTIVTASADKTARIWEAASGALIRVLEGHTNWVNSAVYAPDGRTIVTASRDNTARIWEAESGALIRVLEGHTDRVNSAAFAPDGRHIVTASGDGTARIWDAESGALLRTLEGHTDRVNSAAYSPDGRHIVTASSDKTARIWEAESGALIRTLDGHTSTVNSAAVAPDGRTIVTASGSYFGGKDKTARIWEAESGALIRVLEGHTSIVNSAAVTPDGRTIVTASGSGFGNDDRTARIWDAESGALIRVLEGHTRGVNSAAVAPDGRHIVTASGDGTARIWEAAAPAMEDEGGASAPAHGGSVTSVAVAPDGRTLVTTSFREARIWDAKSGALLRTLEGHTDYVNSVAVAPDGRTLVTASGDHTARIWDAESGAQLRVLEGHTDSVYSAAYAPDGRTLVTASYDQTARIWEAASGALIRVLEGHTRGVNSAAYAPDGRTLVTASSDKTARIWDAESGALIRVLEGHTSTVNSACYSPDGRHIVTASLDQTARIWDVASGALIRVLAGHTNWVNSAAVAPDGRHIVTASGSPLGGGDNTARIWEAASGACVAVIHCDAAVNSAAWFPDGEWIALGCADGRVLWVRVRL